MFPCNSDTTGSEVLLYCFLPLFIFVVVVVYIYIVYFDLLFCTDTVIVCIGLVYTCIVVVVCIYIVYFDLLFCTDTVVVCIGLVYTYIVVYIVVVVVVICIDVVLSTFSTLQDCLEGSNLHLASNDETVFQNLGEYVCMLKSLDAKKDLVSLLPQFEQLVKRLLKSANQASCQ